MAVTEIIRFNQTSAAQDPSTIQEAIEALRESKRARHESLGTEIHNPSSVQITAEWDDDHQIHPGWSHIVDNVQEYLGQPTSVFHAALDQPTLGPDGAATANVIEFAMNYFPASQVTPGFKAKIEADFAEFDRICMREFKGHSGLSTGWVVEEQAHSSIKGEKAGCFLIIRGWDSFDYFQRSTATEGFKEAIQILLAWNAPLDMWHVERKS